MDNQPISTASVPPAPTPEPTPNPAPEAEAADMEAPTNPSIVEQEPERPFGPDAPGTLSPTNQFTATSDATPIAQPVLPQNANPAPVVAPSATHKPLNRNLIETILLVIVSLLAVTFIALFVWKYLEWDAIRTDVDEQVNRAVSMAVAENTTKLETEFVEREKYPYKTFTGPADYGSLSFEYPKTWNVYINRDLSNGGDFEAYLNPGEVLPVSATTINALRVYIRSTAFDSVARLYDSSVQSGRLKVVTRQVGAAVANVYTGEISSGIMGVVTIFKLRDKTVILQTDAMLFVDEYNKLLDSVTFVE